MDVSGARSNALGARRAVGHALVLAATGVAVARTWGTAFMVLAVPVHGVVLSALFCATHECLHRTAFRNRRVNDVVAVVAGAPLLLPSRWFRLFHAAHHRSTQDPAHDPELRGRRRLTRSGIVLHALGLHYWWSMLGVLVSLGRGRTDGAYVPAAHAPAVVREARALAAVLVIVLAMSLALRSPLALQLWIVPALVGQPFLRAFLLAEHGGCPEVPDMTANTRTTLTNPVVRWLTWNMPFHTEHHARPSVPFHALPALHATMANELQVVGRGYVRTYLALQRQRWRSAR